MDVDSMVTSMMTANRVPLDKLNQQKQLLVWQRDSYRELNSKLFDFRNNKITAFNKSTELNTQKSVITGNTESIKAEATADAQKVSMTVSVKSLATQASVETSGLGFGYKSTMTLDKVTNGSTSTEYSVSINGKEFSFNGSTSISKVVSTINSDSEAKATASFDEVTGKLKITSASYGEKSKIEVQDGSTGNTSLLKLFGSGTTQEVGKNAQLIINGEKLTSESNTLKINGIVLTFLSTTGISPNESDDQSKDSNPVKVSVQTDTDKALATVKSFIEEYNSLMVYLSSKAGEEKYRGFAPLTDEQKKEMTENDIKLWEEKSKSGLLKNDQIIRSTVSSMREIISGNLDSLSSLGITTGKYFENGKLYLDEEKLKQALQTNPQQLSGIFQGNVSSSSKGIFGKMSEMINGSLDKLANKAGTSKFSGDLNSVFKEESVLGRQLKDYNKRISDFQIKLTNLETRYYKQFTAMETAMNKYNSQSSSLAGYFS